MTRVNAAPCRYCGEAPNATPHSLGTSGLSIVRMPGTLR